LFAISIFSASRRSPSRSAHLGPQSRLCRDANALGLHAKHAGTGQLFIHALKGTRVSKTLVLPVDEISKRTKTRLSALDIDVLGYRIKAKKVIFLP
jgi:hypothetical protein